MKNWQLVDFSGHIIIDDMGKIDTFEQYKGTPVRDYEPGLTFKSTNLNCKVEKIAISKFTPSTGTLKCGLILVGIQPEDYKLASEKLTSLTLNNKDGHGMLMRSDVTEWFNFEVAQLSKGDLDALFILLKVDSEMIDFLNKNLLFQKVNPEVANSKTSMTFQYDAVNANQILEKADSKNTEKNPIRRRWSFDK